MPAVWQVGSATVAGAKAGKVGKGLEVHLRSLGLTPWVVRSHYTVFKQDLIGVCICDFSLWSKSLDGEGTK